MLIYGDPNIAVWQILHLYSPATQSINRAFRAGDPLNVPAHTPIPWKTEHRLIKTGMHAGICVCH